MQAPAATATFSRTMVVAMEARGGAASATFSAKAVLPVIRVLQNGLVKNFDPGGIAAITEIKVDPSAQDWQPNMPFACPQGFGLANTFPSLAGALGIPADTGIPLTGADRGTWVSGTAYAKYDKAVDPVDGLQYVTSSAHTSTTRPGLDSRWNLATRNGFAPRSIDAGFYGSVRRTGDATRWFSCEEHALGVTSNTEPTATGVDGTVYWTRNAPSIYKGAWAASTVYATGDLILEDGSIWRAATGGTSGTVEPDWVNNGPNYGNTVGDGVDVLWQRRYVYQGAWSAGATCGFRVVNNHADVRGDAVLASDGAILNISGIKETDGVTGATEPAWSTASSSLKYWEDGTLIWRFGTFAVNDPTLQNERLVISGFGSASNPPADGQQLKVTNDSPASTLRDVVLADRFVLNRSGAQNLPGTDKESTYPFDFGGKNVRLAEGESVIVTFSTATGLWTAGVTMQAPAASSTFSGLASASESVQSVPASVTMSAPASAALAPQSPASLSTFSALASAELAPRAGATATMSGLASVALSAQSPSSLVTFSGRGDFVLGGFSLTTAPASVSFSMIASAELAAKPPAASTAFSGTASAGFVATAGGTVTFSAIGNAGPSALTSPPATATFSALASGQLTAKPPAATVTYSSVVTVSASVSARGTTTFAGAAVSLTLAAVSPGGTSTFSGLATASETLTAPSAVASFSSLARASRDAVGRATFTASGGAVSGLFTATTTPANVTFSARGDAVYGTFVQAVPATATFSAAATVPMRFLAVATASFSAQADAKMTLTTPAASTTYSAVAGIESAAGESVATTTFGASAFAEWAAQTAPGTVTFAARVVYSPVPSVIEPSLLSIGLTQPRLLAATPETPVVSVSLPDKPQIVEVI